MPVSAHRVASAEAVDLMGVDIDALTERQVIDTILSEVAEGRGGWLCPINLDVLRQAVDDAEVKALVEPATLMVADGMPLLWAASVAGYPLPERVAGSTLLTTLPAHAAARGASLFFLGGNDGTAEASAEILRREHPDLRISGTLCPPFGFEGDEAEMDRIRKALRTARPDIVFVGLGFPKQERLIAELRDVLPSAWFVSCGVSFSFLSGEISRAPEWMQRSGMEWLHRVTNEPRRLYRRYFLDGIPFAARLLFGALEVRLRGNDPRRPSRLAR